MYLTPQHILLAGASGLTGEHLLDRLLNEPTVTRVLAPSRKPLAEHPRLENPVGDPAVFLPQLSGRVDIAFCCLGTTRKDAGSAEAFRRVDLDYVLAFAALARLHGCRRLLVVSSLGANPGSPALYPRTKGEMEQALLAQEWQRLVILRPAMLLGHREPARRSEQIIQAIYPLVKPLLRGSLRRWRAIEASQVAHAMARLAIQESGIETVENERLLTL